MALTLTVATAEVVLAPGEEPMLSADGAARVLDPVFTGVATGEHPWGRFWKDYRVVDW